MISFARDARLEFESPQIHLTVVRHLQTYRIVTLGLTGFDCVRRDEGESSGPLNGNAYKQTELKAAA